SMAQMVIDSGHLFPITPNVLDGGSLIHKGSGYSSGPVVLAGGAVFRNGGTIDFVDSAGAGFQSGVGGGRVEDSGQLSRSSPSLTPIVSFNTPFLNAGTLHVMGNIQFASLENSGRVSLDLWRDPIYTVFTVLNVTGSYVQTDSGVLATEITDNNAYTRRRG